MFVVNLERYAEEGCEKHAINVDAASDFNVTASSVCSVVADYVDAANYTDTEVDVSSVSSVSGENIQKPKRGRKPDTSNKLGVIPIVGDGKYSYATHKREYFVWRGLLRRVLKNSKSLNPTYESCTISAEFLNFQSFVLWYENQLGYSENWHIDKDILGGKHYSQETCLLIPRCLNNFFRSSGSSAYGMAGVQPRRKRFRGRLTRYSDGRSRFFHLGTFDTPEEAFQAYKKAKELYAKEIAAEWYGKVDQRVINALMSYEVHQDGSFTCDPTFTEHEYVVTR